MDKLYLRGVIDDLRPVLVEFDRLCQKCDVKYTILLDEPMHQRFSISTESLDLVKSIRAFASKHKIVVENQGQTLDFAYGKPHVDSGSYGLDLIDDDVRFKIGSAAIGYLGERHAPLIRENMQGLVIPIKQINTDTLWKTHLNHPRYAELGEDKSCYVGVLADFPPLVVDTLDEGAPVKHAGVLVDGFRRLYASYYRQEPNVRAIDIADVVSEIKNRLGITLEDQYKSPTRKMIRKQSAHPSSFGPSKSFGGVSKYNGNDKYPKKMDECYQGEVGKLKSDLLAHDNKTIVPKGTIVKVVDGDEGLPDIKYDGKIVNVDRDALEERWKPATFAQQLDAALVESKEPAGEVEKSEFENTLSSILGTISIVEPEILFTIRPNK